MGLPNLTYVQINQANWKVFDFEDCATIPQKMMKQTKSDVLMFGFVFGCTIFGNCARLAQNCAAQKNAHELRLIFFQTPGLHNCKSTKFKNRHNWPKMLYTIYYAFILFTKSDTLGGVLFCSANNGRERECSVLQHASKSQTAAQQPGIAHAERPVPQSTSPTPWTTLQRTRLPKHFLCSIWVWLKMEDTTNMEISINATGFGDTATCPAFDLPGTPIRNLDDSVILGSYLQGPLWALNGATVRTPAVHGKHLVSSVLTFVAVLFDLSGTFAIPFSRELNLLPVCIRYRYPIHPYTFKLTSYIWNKYTIVAYPLVASTTYPKLKTSALLGGCEDPIRPPVLGGCQP